MASQGGRCYLIAFQCCLIPAIRFCHIGTSNTEFLTISLPVYSIPGVNDIVIALRRIVFRDLDHHGSSPMKRSHIVPVPFLK
jgi:hypothetical protein